MPVQVFWPQGFLDFSRWQDVDIFHKSVDITGMLRILPRMQICLFRTSATFENTASRGCTSGPISNVSCRRLPSRVQVIAGSTFPLVCARHRSYARVAYFRSVGTKTSATCDPVNSATKSPEPCKSPDRALKDPLARN